MDVDRSEGAHTPFVKFLNKIYLHINLLVEC